MFLGIFHLRAAGTVHWAGETKAALQEQTGGLCSQWLLVPSQTGCAENQVDRWHTGETIADARRTHNRLEVFVLLYCC